jgi:hypothetical protein
MKVVYRVVSSVENNFFYFFLLESYLGVGLDGVVAIQLFDGAGNNGTNG